MTSDSQASTRRHALRLGGATLAGLVVVPAMSGRAFAAPSPERVEEVLVVRALIGMERALLAAYDAAARALALAGETANRFAEQERAHVEVLSEALERLGGIPPRSEPPAPPFDPAARAPEVVAALLDLELRAMRAYFTAISSVRGGPLVGILARVMASEGQHASVLRLAVNRAPVPHAFETGEGRLGANR